MFVQKGEWKTINGQGERNKRPRKRNRGKKEKKWRKRKSWKNKEGKEKSRSEKAREKKKEKASNEDTEVPYPVVPSKKDKDHHLARFLDIFKKLEITMPFGEALKQVSLYSKFRKDMLTRKNKYSFSKIWWLKLKKNQNQK